MTYSEPLLNILKRFLFVFKNLKSDLKVPEMSFQIFFWKNHSPPKCIWQDHQNLHEVQIFSINSPRPNKNNLTDAMPNMIHILNQKSYIFPSKTTQKKSQHPLPTNRPPKPQTHPFEAPDPKGRCRPSK